MSTHRYIRTKSGTKVYFRRPTMAMIKLDDIIWSLSRQHRFLGHTEGEPLTIAQHACMVHDLCPDEFKPEGLHHDDAESWIGDCVSPLKMLLHPLLDTEVRFEKLVARRFGLRYPWPAAVRQADLTSLANEMKSLTNRRDWRDLPFAPSGLQVVPWTAAKARDEFVKRWRECVARNPRLRA